VADHILAQPMPDPKRPVRLDAYRTTATAREIGIAQAAQMRDQADALDQAGPISTIHASVQKMQAEESYRCDDLARAAAMLEGRDFNTLPRGRQADLRAGATYLLRRPETAWRAAAQAHAEPCVAQLLRETCGLSPEAAKALAIEVVALGVAAYQQMLEGGVVLAPGQYLRIQAARREEDQ
jgi:hypothetical protein